MDLPPDICRFVCVGVDITIFSGLFHRHRPSPAQAPPTLPLSITNANIMCRDNVAYAQH